jgi:cytochrome c oxidase subunit 3
MSSAHDHAPAHDDEHNPHLAHHFDTMGQQAGAAKLGMWLFLATEILMFSGLFLAYFILRMFYPEMVLEAHEHLSKTAGGINTVVLLTSSYTMALGVRSIQLNDVKKLRLMLVLTILCGCIFMVVKYFEYSAKFAHGMLPGKFYSAHLHGYEIEGLPHIFFGVYFMMTGLHGFHVLIGLLIMLWMFVRAGRGEFSSKNYVAIENTGLYWHLVDLIWIFLFPLLYLIH